MQLAGQITERSCSIPLGAGRFNLQAPCGAQVPACNQGMQDAHPYVRRTAVMGVMKVYNIDASLVANAGMLDEVKKLLLNDTDTQVISNCMSVLDKVRRPCHDLAVQPGP